MTFSGLKWPLIISHHQPCDDNHHLRSKPLLFAARWSLVTLPTFWSLVNLPLWVGSQMTTCWCFSCPGHTKTPRTKSIYFLVAFDPTYLFVTLATGLHRHMFGYSVALSLSSPSPTPVPTLNPSPPSLSLKVCVCVWTFSKEVKLVPKSRGHRRPIELCPTKLSMVSLGYLAWSARRTCLRHELYMVMKQRLGLLLSVFLLEKLLLPTHDRWNHGCIKTPSVSLFSLSVLSVVVSDKVLRSRAGPVQLPF